MQGCSAHDSADASAGAGLAPYPLFWRRNPRPKGGRRLSATLQRPKFRAPARVLAAELALEHTQRLEGRRNIASVRLHELRARLSRIGIDRERQLLLDVGPEID